jgi:hypothetical protein
MAKAAYCNLFAAALAAPVALLLKRFWDRF